LAKKIAIRTRRAKLTDFQRFEATLGRKELARKTRIGVTGLRKAQKAKGGDKTKKVAEKPKDKKKWENWGELAEVFCTFVVVNLFC